MFVQLMAVMFYTHFEWVRPWCHTVIRNSEGKPERQILNLLLGKFAHCMIDKIYFLFQQVCSIVYGLGAIYVSYGLDAFIHLKFGKEASFSHVTAGLPKTFIRMMAKHFLNG
jgi:hypothetical protein